MKPARIFALGMFTALMMVVIAVAAFQVGTAFAATGCFTDTNGHVYETAICWLKANGIVSGTTFSPNAAATRATTAQWLYKQSQIPPTQGVILVSAGNTAWVQAYYLSDIQLIHNVVDISIMKGSIGDNYFQLQPNLPVALYGRSLKLLGVELCYAASPEVMLTGVEIITISSPNGWGYANVEYSDTANYTDAACRYFVLPTPITLQPDQSLLFNIKVTWSLPSITFSIARTTFVLKPTATKVSAPSADSPNAVLLTDTTGGETAP